jgi:hypothetical protein
MQDDDKIVNVCGCLSHGFKGTHMQQGRLSSVSASQLH